MQKNTLRNLNDFHSKAFSCNGRAIKQTRRKIQKNHIRKNKDYRRKPISLQKNPLKALPKSISDKVESARQRNATNLCCF